MSGRSSAVRALLAHGADVNALDATFSGTPLLWASQGWSHNPDNSADYMGAARLLIGAGSSLEWLPPPKTPDPERAQELLIELCRTAAGST
jgi:hypothetical protein